MIRLTASTVWTFPNVRVSLPTGATSAETSAAPTVRRGEEAEKNKDFLEKVLFFLKSHLWISRLSVCQAGGWHCSENSCPPRCLLEGQFVTTFDGKQYAVPGKCAYVASQVIVDSTWLKINLLKRVWLLTAVFFFKCFVFKALNWTIMVRFSEKYTSLHTAVLQLPQVLGH